MRSSSDLRVTRLKGLTQRQSQVAVLIAAGHSNDEIAAQLRVSLATVKNHVNGVYRGLNVSSRTAVTKKLQVAAR